MKLYHFSLYHSKRARVLLRCYLSIKLKEGQRKVEDKCENTWVLTKLSYGLITVMFQPQKYLSSYLVVQGDR